MSGYEKPKNQPNIQADLEEAYSFSNISLLNFLDEKTDPNPTVSLFDNSDPWSKEPDNANTKQSWLLFKQQEEIDSLKKKQFQMEHQLEEQKAQMAELQTQINLILQFTKGQQQTIDTKEKKIGELMAQIQMHAEAPISVPLSKEIPSQKTAPQPNPVFELGPGQSGIIPSSFLSDLNNYDTEQSKLSYPQYNVGKKSISLTPSASEFIPKTANATDTAPMPENVGKQSIPLAPSASEFIPKTANDISTAPIPENVGKKSISFAPSASEFIPKTTNATDTAPMPETATHKSKNISNTNTEEPLGGDIAIKKQLNKVFCTLPGIWTLNPIAAVTNFCLHQLRFELNFEIIEKPSSNPSEPNYEVIVCDEFKNPFPSSIKFQHSRKKFSKEQAARKFLIKINLDDSFLCDLILKHKYNIFSDIPTIDALSTNLSDEHLKSLYSSYRKNLNLSEAEIERCLDLDKNSYTETVPSKIIELLEERKAINKIFGSLPAPNTTNPIAALTNFCRHQLHFDIDFFFIEEPSSNPSEPLHIVRVLDNENKDIVQQLSYQHRKKDYAKEQAAIKCLNALNGCGGYDIISYYIEKKAKISEESRMICEELPATNPADQPFNEPRGSLLTSYSMIDNNLVLPQKNDATLKENQSYLSKAKLGT